MVIDLYPDDVTGEARGIRAAFLGNTMLVMIGFLVALFFLKRMKRGAPGALPATDGTP